MIIEPGNKTNKMSCMNGNKLRIDCSQSSQNVCLLLFTLTLTTLWANLAHDKLIFFFFFFSSENRLTFHVNCLQIKQFVQNIKAYKFSGKNKQNVSKCCLKVLLSVLIVN